MHNRAVVPLIGLVLLIGLSVGVGVFALSLTSDLLGDQSGSEGVPTVEVVSTDPVIIDYADGPRVTRDNTESLEIRGLDDSNISYEFYSGEGEIKPGETIVDGENAAEAGIEPGVTIVIIWEVTDSERITQELTIEQSETAGTTIDSSGNISIDATADCSVGELDEDGQNTGKEHTGCS